MILILLLAFLIRLTNLNQSLWLDEAISVTTVQKYSFLEILTKFIIHDVHPPLYYLILDLWGSLFGYSELAMRFPSVLFGVLTCFFVYKIGLKLFGKKAGLVAAFFLAINPLAIYYSQEVRMYSLAALAVTAAIYCLLQRRLFWAGVFVLLSIYTDYLPLLMFPIYIFLSPWILLTLIFYLPWLPVLISQLKVGANFAQAAPEWGRVVGAGSLKNLILVWIKFIFGRITLDNKLFYAAVAGPVSLICLFITLKAKNKFLWAWLLVPIILGFLISLKIPIFGYHRFLFVLPAFCLLLAAGALNTKYPSSIFRVCFVSVVSLTAVIFFNLNPSFHRENWRDALSYINSDPGTIVMPSRAQAAPILYYAPSLVVQDKNNFNPTTENVYLLRYVQELFNPTDSHRLSLESKGYKKVEEKGFNGVLIWKYKK